LVINNGSLVVSSGSFTLDNNANLIQNQTGVNTSNSGNIIVKRDSNPLSRLDYTLWSSPVAAQKLNLFSPWTTTTRFYTYDPLNNVYLAVPSPSATDFVAGTGYLIRMPNTAVSYPATETFTGIFTGTPNNGAITLTVDSGTYNAIGNPYPSTLNADAFIAANGITEALYFWRKTNNSALSSYATYTSGGGGVANIGGGSTIVPNGTLQVGQGFIVKATSTSLSFTNAMRTATNANQILRTKAVERNRIWLNLFNEAVPVNQMLVGYISGATSEIDATIDGRYFNDSQTALNSLIGNEEFAIQGRSLPFDGTDVVPLAFKTTTAGNFTIAIDHMDGLFSGSQDIFLRDNTTGTETNLKATAYTFTAAAGVDNARFSLKYQKTLGVSNPVFDDNSVTVYKNKGTLYVNSGAVAIANIKIFDIQGRLIAERNNVKANSASINNLKSTKQVLIVKITSQDDKVVSKKVVN
jgi:hypothetical protein